MKNLKGKFKPVLRKGGVFYPNPIKEDPQCILVLEETSGELKGIKDYQDAKRKILGFSAHHKITGNLWKYRSIISQEIGKPGIYLIFYKNEPVDYASNLDLAISKGHEYLFNKILEEIVAHSTEVCNSLFDTTKIGLEKFNKLNKNKANLSAKSPENE
jgi:hypothetical protein